MPDFLRCPAIALEAVVAARPDVFNHNLETVPGLYPEVRPGARYFHSLRLLQRVKELDPAMFTKSGIMVGLGEERQAVRQVMDDLRAADVDFLTVGQYLQPTPKHHAVARFVTPEEFAAYEKAAFGKGFLMVSATPLTRSSYHAGADFARLRAARLAKLGQASIPVPVDCFEAHRRQGVHTCPWGQAPDIKDVSGLVNKTTPGSQVPGRSAGARIPRRGRILAQGRDTAALEAAHPGAEACVHGLT